MVIRQLVVFALEDQAYALRLAAVERVARMVSVTPLPKAPEIVMGVVNVRGRIVPVFDVRRRFRLPPRVREYPEEAIVEARSILPGVEYVEGVVKLADGLILIHDLDGFLSLQEEESLGRALPAA